MRTFLICMHFLSMRQEQPVKVFRHVEYVTVRVLFWKHKVKHVDWLILRKGVYYWKNMSQVEVFNYKVEGSPEVFVKK